MKLGKHATYHLYNSCLRKLTYESEEEAEGKLREMLEHPREPDLKPHLRLHTYACDFAPHFHIGHGSGIPAYMQP